MLNVTIDKIDWRILRELQIDARLTNVALAERIGMSPSPCLLHVKRLEADGVIRHYGAVIDSKQVGLSIACLFNVTLERNIEETLEAFKAAISESPEILECWPVTGETDFLLKVVTADIGDYESLNWDHILCLPGVSSTQTNFLLTPVKNETALPLEVA